MTRKVHAVFDGKVLHLEESVSLEPNTRVLITIETEEEAKTQKGSFLRTARSLNLEGPADWSTRLEDYLYEDKTDATE